MIWYDMPLILHVTGSIWHSTCPPFPPKTYTVFLMFRKWARSWRQWFDECLYRCQESVNYFCLFQFLYTCSCLFLSIYLEFNLFSSLLLASFAMRETVKKEKYNINNYQRIFLNFRRERNNSREVVIKVHFFFSRVEERRRCTFNSFFVFVMYLYWLIKFRLIISLRTSKFP